MPFRTQAFVNGAVNAGFVLQDIELDDPQPTEVLVQIKSCGLCHTGTSFSPFLPLVLQCLLTYPPRQRPS